MDETRVRTMSRCNLMDKVLLFVTHLYNVEMFYNDTLDIRYICDNKYVQNASET